MLNVDRKKISLLFGGVGDARNFLMTLIFIGAEAQSKKLPVDKSFHITIVDIKPASIARDLLVFLILDEIAAVKDSEELWKRRLHYLLYYMYLSPIMPTSLYTLLQSRIRRALDCLEGRSTMSKWLDVPHMFRPEIARVLKQWQEEAIERYPTQAVREKTVCTSGRVITGMPVPMPKDCEKQQAFYLKTGILLLSNKANHILEKESPGISKAYAAFDQARLKM